MNDPLRLSASAVRAFLECPYRFARDFVDRLPDTDREPVPSFAFGNAVHRALADFIRQGGWRAFSSDELIAMYMRHWEGGVYPDADTELYHFHRGREMLTRYYDNPYPGTVEKELGVEQYTSWRTARKGFLATGKLDRACLLPGNVLEIVDYKTGSWIPKEDDLKKEYQALFYRTLGADHYRAFRPAAIQVTYYFLSVGKAISVSFDQVEFLERWLEVEAVAQQIREALDRVREGQTLAQIFPLNRSNNCSRCPMRAHCDRLDEADQKEAA